MVVLIVVLFIACTSSVKKNSTATSLSDSTELTKNTSAQIFAKKQIPVLCYHRIENSRNDEYTVSVNAFEEQMKILSDSGYHTVSPNELYDYLVYNASLPEKAFLITFDDSRVEHHDVAAPVMEKYDFHGTFFIMTITYNKKNYMTKEQIADLAKRGHTIGMHSWDHLMVTKYNTEEIWDNEIANPIKELEKITGQKVEFFAYPYGICDHERAVKLQQYFKLSFILSTKRDETLPLQTVRRMIVPSGWSPQSMLKAMQKTFDRAI